MTELLVLTLGLLGVLICIADWRKGIFVCILAGFLQDPLRKLTEGEPISLTVIVAVFTVITLIGAKMRVKRFGLKHIPAWDGTLRRPALWFVGLVFMQSVMAFINTGSIIVSAIGLLAYLAPLPALLLSYYYSREEEDIARFIKFYLLAAVLMTSGIYLSYLDFDWAVLRQVGAGIFAFSPSGELLKLHSGFFRAPETAAWHAGTAICMTVLLFVSTKRTIALRWISGVLIVLFAGAIILTGRRKILVEIVFFISIYSFLLAYFRRGAAKLALFILLVGVSFALISNAYIFTDPIATGFHPYFERGVSVRQEAGERMYNMTIGSVRWVIAQNGFFGAGAGTGSQGSQHFGGGDVWVGGAAEGGLGKILAELGVPGLVLLAWVVIRLVRYLWKTMVDIRKDNPIRSRLVYGMVSFLIANAIIFVTAHQVFGDPFVLLILGWVLGFVFALPSMKPSEINKQSVITDIPSLPSRNAPPRRLKIQTK